MYVNPQGCGYPPTVSCEAFFARHGGHTNTTNETTKPIVTFPCFYSRTNSSFVLPEHDISDAYNGLAFCCVPVATVAVSAVVVSILTVYLQRKERKRKKLKQEEEQ